MINKQKDYWCHSCGTKLIPHLWKGNFNEETGIQYTGFNYKCPRNAWWKLGHNEFYHFSI